jgi:hypothetical protein
MSRTKTKSIVFFSVLMLLSLLFSAICAEIGIRIYMKSHGKKFGLDRMEPFTRSWPVLQGVENKKYFFELKHSFKSTLEGFTYQHNDQGLRDNKETFKYNPDAYNIVLVGSSQTYGVGINYEDTWGYLLQQKLNSHYASEGKKFEVWNAGVPARHMEQNLEAFKDTFAKLKPDMAIFDFEVDMFIRPMWHYRGGILYIPEKNYWFQKIIYQSDLLSFIVFRLKNLGINPYYYYANYYENVSARWEYALGLVKEMDATCKKLGIKLVVVDLPALYWQGKLKKEDWVEYRLFNTKLEEFCRQEGIAYHNTIDAFEGYEAQDMWATPGYDNHFNPRATRLIADSFFKKLVEMNPVKSK